MQAAFRHGLFRICLTIALMVSLAAIGLAHRVPTASSLAADALVLAGVDLSALCADPHEGGQAARGDCPACHIVKAFDLPPQVAAPRALSFGVVVAVAFPGESRAIRRVLDPALGAQAPPPAV
ncbi:MAG: hypothetical protein IT542_07405 [Rubellimicrobium sp.]|nr:hypothetical protein [Rubellimicrobium sp.]